jgi:valyl-tRNA synthetase
MSKQVRFRIVSCLIRIKQKHHPQKKVGNVIDPIDVIEGATLEQLHDGLRNGNLDQSKVDDGIKLQKKVYGATKVTAKAFLLCKFLVVFFFDFFSCSGDS